MCDQALEFYIKNKKLYYRNNIPTLRNVVEGDTCIMDIGNIEMKHISINPITPTIIAINYPGAMTTEIYDSGKLVGVLNNPYLRWYSLDLLFDIDILRNRILIFDLQYKHKATLTSNHTLIYAFEYDNIDFVVVKKDSGIYLECDGKSLFLTNKNINSNDIYMISSVLYFGSSKLLLRDM